MYTCALHGLTFGRLYARAVLSTSVCALTYCFNDVVYKGREWKRTSTCVSRELGVLQRMRDACRNCLVIGTLKVFSRHLHF